MRPLGVSGATTVDGLPIDPAVVFSVKELMLSELLFETNRNWPVLLTLGCKAIETGCDPVGWFAGDCAVNTPVVVLILNPKT